VASYRAEELARLAGTTTRNIRAYRERGLLAPPALTGRTGWYDDTHLGRLRLITRLLERGYTLGNIAELLAAWERGRSFDDILGVQQAVTRPLSDEPWVGTAQQVADAAGIPLDELPLRQLESVGLVERDGERVLVALPGLIRDLGELVRVGLPVPLVVELLVATVTSLDILAHRLVSTVGETLYPADAAPVPVEEFEADLETLLRVAADAVTRVFGWSLERQLAGELGRSVERRWPEPEVQTEVAG
jgi:DNA-binding transcriptional MerR regulator